jgi:hypothetical protein
MKNEICKALVTLGLAGTLGGVVLTAQDGPREIGNVPFAFQVGDKTLPPGKYAATELNLKGLVQLTNEATRQSILIGAFVPKDGNPGQSKLMFHCYSGRCFLSEIWYPQESSGHGLKASRLEKEMAANSHEEKKVYVAMR